MTTAYVKTSVGSKLFTVSWQLESDPIEEISGDPFEAVDCHLLSINSVANSGLEGRLALSNHLDPMSYRFPIVINDLVLSDMPDNIQLPLPPVRWYYPYIGAATALTMRTSLLFREI